MNAKDLRKLLCEAQRQGYTVKTRKSGHHLLYAPDGTFITTIAGTSSDWRSEKNSLATLKRSGFTPKGTS